MYRNYYDGKKITTTNKQALKANEIISKSENTPNISKNWKLNDSEVLYFSKNYLRDLMDYDKRNEDAVDKFDNIKNSVERINENYKSSEDKEWELYTQYKFYIADEDYGPEMDGKRFANILDFTKNTQEFIN